MSTFEVEIKFQIVKAQEVEHRLRSLFGNVEFGEPITETDSFFRHPCRNFKQTDEALRLRKRECADGTSEHSLTYKGPKIDTTTKTRQEIELPITEPERWESLLTALGFSPFASVQKFRRHMKLMVNHRHIEIVLDTLPALSESHRTFIEVETLATVEDIEECRTLILGIAKQLELGTPIQESYLQMVLKR